MIPPEYLRPMKALTVWQPWASLLACGAKKYETRSWAPKSLKAGDLVAIHSAKRPVQTEGDDRALAEVTFRAWRSCPSSGFLSVGKVLAICRFEWYEKIADRTPVRTPTEEVVGDWTPGRFAWRIEPLHVFREPIPAQGKQGLWTWTPPSAAEREA
jgi:hypothetical protein